MKNPVKAKSVMSDHKGITKAPVFKKKLSSKKIKDEKTTKAVIAAHKDLTKGSAHKGLTKDSARKDILPKKHITDKITSKSIIAVDKDSKTSMSKKILPSTYITEQIASKAVIALRKLAEQQKKNKIFEEESVVLAQINCIKIQTRKTTVKVNLPHSTMASTGEVCLITTDLKKGRKHDHEPSVDHWEDVLKKAGVTEVKTVLPMRQLRVEYDQYELKRRLLTQHDFILVDSRIHGHVCHILGKVFQNKHNMLIPVRLHDVKDLKKSIQSALNVSLLHLSEGLTSAVTIGHMGMSTKQLKENIMALVKELAKKYPGGEQNIRTLHVKLPLSLAVPLYFTLRSKKSITTPKVHSQLPKSHTTVEGELTTVLGSTVKITPDGNISLKRNAELMSDYEDELSEIEAESPKSMNKKQKLTKNKKQKPMKAKDPIQSSDQDDSQEDCESDENCDS